MNQTVEQRAIVILRRIEKDKAEVAKLLNGSTLNGTTNVVRKPMTKTARAKIAAAQRKRWKAIKAGQK